MNKAHGGSKRRIRDIRTLECRRIDRQVVGSRDGIRRNRQASRRLGLGEVIDELHCLVRRRIERKALSQLLRGRSRRDGIARDRGRAGDAVLRAVRAEIESGTGEKSSGIDKVNFDLHRSRLELATYIDGRHAPGTHKVIGILAGEGA